jgi:signal transduction histidine kinase
MINAVRHSGGTHCAISILVDDSAVEVLVRDDGHGLVPDRKPAVGLRSMQERAAEVGGTLSVRSTADGTVVSAPLPLSVGGPVDHADPG